MSIAEHIRKSWRQEEITALTDRLKANVAVVGHLDAASHAEAKVPCALLDASTKQCSVYERRPLSCRTIFSPDAEICRIALEPDQNPPAATPEQVESAAVEITFGLADAMEDRGIDRNIGPPSVFELQSAVLAALLDPNVGAAWYGGEEPFAECPE